MRSKCMLFVVTGMLLVLAIYSSSSYFVFAEIITNCQGASKTTTYCSTYDTETDEGHNYKCTKNKDGKTWSCEEVKAVKAESISPALDNALDAAIKGNSQISPKVPNLQDLPQLQSTNNSTN